MTKKLLFSILISSFLIFVKALGQTADTFNIETLHYKTDVNILSVASWHDNFYCLKASGELLIIDSVNNMTVFPILQKSFIFLYTLNDSLFGLCLNGSLFNIQGTSIVYYNKSSILFDRPFFEDEDFKVERTYSGEWGGSVYFTEKMTGKKYEFAATCPSYIKKLNNIYYVIANSNHMTGSTEIIQINNPLELKEYNRDYLKELKQRYAGDEESSLKQGTIRITNTLERKTIMSFPYNNKLYHIVNESNKSFLCEVEDNHLVTISLISETALSTDNRYEFLSKDNPYLIAFENYKGNGFLSIKGNLIKKYMFEKE